MTNEMKLRLSVDPVIVKYSLLLSLNLRNNETFDTAELFQHNYSVQSYSVKFVSSFFLPS